MDNYWANLTQRRLSRRRALVAAGATAAGALFLGMQGRPDHERRHGYECG